MSYTAVQDRSTMDLSTVKALLGVTDSSQDALINLHLATAKEAADNYLNNPFHKWDMEAEEYVSPVVELAIPATVEEGVFEYVRLRMVQQRAATQATSISTQESPATVRVGSWSHSPVVPGVNTATGGVATAQQALRVVQQSYWDQHRLSAGY